MNRVILLIWAIVSFLLSAPFAMAQTTNGNNEYDALYYISASKRWGNFSVAAYTEFTIDYTTPSLNYDYSLLGVKYKILPWLDTALYGGYMESGNTKKWVHVFQLIQTFGWGNTKLWFSEKVCHRRDIHSGSNEGLIRLRGNLQYHIPNTVIMPFVSSETYLWDEWKRTNIHAGARWKISRVITLSTYYMASVRPTLTKHFLVIGLSFSIQ